MASASGSPRPFLPARHLVLAALLGAVLAAIPLLYDRHAYFRDDMETYFMPTLVAIGRTMWSDGVVPLMTLQTWVGGNLAGEFQYGLFNPILLALYAALALFETQADAAAFLCVALGGVLASGGFALARACRLCLPLAYVAAGAVGGNNFLYYWFAVSWFPGYSSAAFMVWAMAFLLRADEGRGSFICAFLATYLTVTAGWPHTVIALGAFTVCRCAALYFIKGCRPALDVAVAAALGLGAAAVAIGPVLGMFGIAQRSTSMASGGQLLPNLRDVLLFASPLHLGILPLFQGFSRVLAAPVFYAAWFVLPAIILVHWRRLDWWDPGLITFLAFAAVMLIGTQGPSQLLWLRFPIRFAPYFQIAIVIAALIVVQRAGLAPLSRRRVGALALVIGVAAISSMQSTPALATAHAVFAVLLLYVSVILRRDAERAPRAAMLFLACSTWVIAAATRTFMPSAALPDYGVFARFGLPAGIGSTAPLSAVPRGYELHLSDDRDLNVEPALLERLAVAQAGLARGVSAVNGYSPIGHRGLADLICWSHSRSTCADTLDRILARDPVTGEINADLMRIWRIVAPAGTEGAALARLAQPPFRIVEEDALVVVAERSLPDSRLPGSLAWPLSGYGVQVVGDPTALREVLRIQERDEEVRSLIFARTFWRGYSAPLDGRPLPVRAHAGALLAVDLPPQPRDGELVLTFVPPGLRAGLAMSVAAILAALAYAAFFQGSSRRPNPGG